MYIDGARHDRDAARAFCVLEEGLDCHRGISISYLNQSQASYRFEAKFRSLIFSRIQGLEVAQRWQQNSSALCATAIWTTRMYVHICSANAI